MTPDEDLNCPENVSEICDTWAEYAGYIFVFTPVTICGFFLNTLNIIVFMGNGSRETITMSYLKALAWFDLMTVVFSLPAGCIRCLPKPPNSSWQFRARGIYEIFVYIPVTNIFGTASVWCTMVLTTERYLHVSQFTWARKLFTSFRQKLSIVLILLASFWLNFPFFFSRTVDEYGSIVFTSYSQTVGYDVFLWLRFAVVKILPIAIVAVANGLLLKVIVDTNKRQKARVHPTIVPERQLQRQRFQNHLSKMLISISAVFLLCHIPEPFSHSSIYAAIHGQCSLHRQAHRIQIMVTNTLEIFSYASNFIFYCVFNKQFQLGLKKLGSCGTSAGDYPKLPTVWEESRRRDERSVTTSHAGI